MSKLILRTLVIEDAKTSWKWRNDPEIWIYTGYKPDVYVDEKIESAWLSEKILETDSKRFAIIFEDVYVGNIQLTNIVENENAQLHVFIGEKDYWNKGIALEAIYQIIIYASKDLELKEIYLFVNPNHKIAIHLYEKIGFTQVDGTIKMKINLLNFNLTNSFKTF